MLRGSFPKLHPLFRERPTSSADASTFPLSGCSSFNLFTSMAQILTVLKISAGWIDSTGFDHCHSPQLIFGLLLGRVPNRYLPNLQIPQANVGRWVMSLDHETAGFFPQSSPRVSVWFSLIGPIAYLDAIHPCRNMGPVRDDRLDKPLLIVCHHKSGIFSSKYSAGSTVFRL